MLAMWIWFGIALVLFIIELMTVDLITIWFAFSGLVLGIITGIAPNLGIGWQIGIFAVFSVGLLFATRPLVRKFLAKRKNAETNLELIIGHKALVTEDIKNDFEQGAIRINGLIWSARSEDGKEIEKGAFVVVKEIHGNKAIVIKN